MRRFVCTSVVLSSIAILGRWSAAGPAAENGAERLSARGITFYASFEESLTADYSAGRSDPINPKWRPLYQQQKIAFGPGKAGNCATAKALTLVYDPVKVFAPDRGSVSFWLRPVDGDMWSLFKVEAKEWGVGPNSRLQMDLYFCTFVFGTSPLLRDGFYRALIRPALRPIEECLSLPELDRDRWHHFVWAWDHTQGMRGYLDGTKIFDNWGTVTWVPMMTPNVIQLGSMQAIDELMFFNRALAPADVSALHACTLPAPPAPEKHTIPAPLRSEVAHSYGLDEGPGYPVVRPDAPVTFTVVDFERAVDGRRPMLYCLDGNRASCWPDSHVELFNSDYLDITYPGEVEANYFRVISDGNRFALSRAGDTTPFWVDEVRPEHDGWSDKLVRRYFTSSPVRFKRLRLDREGARIGELYVYNVTDGALATGADDVRSYGVGRITDIGSIDWASDVYARHHSGPSPAVVADGTEPGPEESVIPGNSLVPFHLLGPVASEPTGIAAVALELAFVPPANKLEDVVRLRIVDPVTSARDLVNTELKLRFDPAKQGAQRFRLAFDMPDFRLNKGARLWVWLVSRDGSALALSGSKFIVHHAPLAAATEAMVRDTMRLVAHTYSWASEGHIWSRSYKWPGDERYYYSWCLWDGLLNIVQNRLAPTNKVVGTYWHAIRPSSHRSFVKWIDYSKNTELRELEHARLEPPETWPNPAGAPDWALYQNALLRSYLRIVRWWHDHRLVYDTGIIGGVGDDTQFTGDAFWIYFASGDRKLFRMLESVTNGSWRSAGMYRGFPARTNDVGHDAEEVVGVWPIMIVADYGNPKYLEMTMETMSLIDFFTTTDTALGHRHFRSWYMSATGMKTQGRYGVDNLANAQFALLGHALAWYNRCPKLVQFYREWCDAWIADLERARKLGVEGPISVRVPDDTPIPHVGGMSSQTMQHHFFVTGLLTGDDKYIDRALRNDDQAFVKYYRGEWDQGMLLRNFAWLRHRLFEDERLKASRAATRPDLFARYLMTRDKQLLAKEYRRVADRFAGGQEYLYTQGQPSLDRLWGLFYEPMFMGMLGGHPTGHRRSSTWPGMAISFVDAGGDLASLVLENRTNEMKCLIFNFNRDRKRTTLRLWQLLPGEYKVTAGPDQDGDDTVDRVTHRETVRVERASRVTVPVPFGKVQVVQVRQVSRDEVPARLPDLAIAADDLSYDHDAGTFEVTVHNVGSRAAGPFEVALLGKRGKALATKSAAGLEAPIDLKPRRLRMSLPLQERVLKEIAQVAVRPTESVREITTENNYIGSQVVLDAIGRKGADDMKRLSALATGLCCSIPAAGVLHAQDGPAIEGAVVYDHNPSTQLGDPVFGTIVADMKHDHPGRCSHGGPVCLEYANGVIAAFYANTSDHNIDGWTEYALSKDGGKTWDKYHKFTYSYDAYQKDPKQPAWVEEGLVTGKGTAVLFVTDFKDGKRAKSGFLRSTDHGSAWTDWEPVDAGFVGYPCAVAVSGDTSYVLFDSTAGPHVLYVSTDDGRTWARRSTLPLDNDKWYGTMCIMADGRLLAGAYTHRDEAHFYYCISDDAGKTWGQQKAAALDKRIRDPELAYLGGFYYLHGRSGHGGAGAHRFVLYQSNDGEHWSRGVVVSGDERGPDGYSHNCIIHKYDKSVPNELMVLYSIVYEGRDTNEYVFFVRP